eukprot:ctg_955.g366
MDSHSVRRTFSASANLVELLHVGSGTTNPLVQSSPQRGVVRSESGALPRAVSPLEAGPTADAESTPVHGSSRSARRDAREAFSQADVIDSGLARLHSFELPLSLADDVDDIDISLPLSEEYLLSKIQEVQYQLQQLREGRDGTAATPAASRQPGGRKRGRLFVVSNRLPVQLQFSGPHHSSRPKVLLSVSGLQSALRSLRSRFSIGWIGRLAQEQQLTPAQQQVARRVLATEHGYVPHPVAHLPLPAGGHRGRARLLHRAVGGVSAGERRLRGHHGRRVPGGRPLLGARFPADAGAAADARPRARRQDRLLPAHALPVERGVPHPADTAAIAGGHPGGRPDRLSHL